ncbi:hypothetical protein BGX26_011048 [Mortierella sp. AD094]|nr:hypothetical protein BGX26_011048 [Mortierella sp. AD094]
MLNPLNLPEILDQIGLYLQRRDLLSCILVCKDWHCSFLPLIPHQAVVSFDSLINPEGTIELQMHQIQRLDFACVTTSEGLDSQGCGRLYHVKLVSFLSPKIDKEGLDSTSEEASVKVLTQMSSFVQRHVNQLKSIELAVVDYQVPLMTSLWDTISTCTRLSSLTLNSVNISEGEVSGFWVACSLLESLVLKRSTLNVSTHCKNRKDSKPFFPRLKNLGLIYVSGICVGVQNWLAQQTPNLESLTCHGSGKWDDTIRLDSFLSTEDWVWPKLHSVDVLGLVLDDRLLEILLGKLETVQRFIMPRTLFAAAACNALCKHHSHSVQELNFLKGMHLNSEMAQVLLESLPNLEKLSFNKIMAKDIVEGGKWVCSRLQLLRTNISFDAYEGIAGAEERIKQQHMVVCKQLGELKQLEILDLKTTTGTEALRPGQWLDLRMEYGIDMMQGLAGLRWFLFAGVYQRKLSGHSSLLKLPKWTLTLDRTTGHCHHRSKNHQELRRQNQSRSQHAIFTVVEILENIFSFLDQHTLRHIVGLVCKTWHTASQHYLMIVTTWVDTCSTPLRDATLAELSLGVTTVFKIESRNREKEHDLSPPTGNRREPTSPS